jgi:hypothetical protein
MSVSKTSMSEEKRGLHEGFMTFTNQNQAVIDTMVTKLREMLDKDRIEDRTPSF